MVDRHEDVKSMDLVDWVVAQTKSDLLQEGEESQWSYCIGRVLEHYDLMDDALSKFRQATHLRPDFWKARYRIAGILADKGHYRDAISTMSRVLEQESSLLDSDEIFAVDYWSVMLRDIATWQIGRAHV